MNTARKLALGGASLMILGAAAPALALDEYSVPSFETVDEADPGYRYPDGSTPLMWAVYENDADEARRLIRAGADVNASNNYGANAMQLAAEVANVDMLDMLLKAGANPDSANPEGQTALMLVARTGDVDAAKLLVRRGADVNAFETWGEQTALMWAAARRQPAMVDYLIRQGADMNARGKWRDYKRHITSEARAKQLDTGGLTPLLYAARENCVECVAVLIQHGVDVDLPDPDRVSPLLFAVLNSNWDVAKLLIEAGADVNQWDMFGQSPLYSMAGARTDTSRASIDALNETSGGEVMRMMLEAGANPNMQLFMRPADSRGGGSRGSTPLHNAAGSRDLEAVQMLLEFGADASLNDADNESALMMAVQGGGGGLFGGPTGPGEDAALPIIDALVEAGADVNAVALFHHLNRLRGGTALHYAVRSGWGDAIDRLVAHGADVNLKDPDGLTALDYAMARGYIPFLRSREPVDEEIAAKLRAHGATVELLAEPYWPPVGPPVYYEATIWPLDPTVPSRSYEEMTPSPFLDEEMEKLQYPGTPQPQAAADNDAEETDQASLDDAQTLR